MGNKERVVLLLGIPELFLKSIVEAGKKLSGLSFLSEDDPDNFTQVVYDNTVHAVLIYVKEGQEDIVKRVVSRILSYNKKLRIGVVFSERREDKQGHFMFLGCEILQWSDAPEDILRSILS